MNEMSLLVFLAVEDKSRNKMHSKIMKSIAEIKSRGMKNEKKN